MQIQEIHNWYESRRKDIASRYANQEITIEMRDSLVAEAEADYRQQLEDDGFTGVEPYVPSADDILQQNLLIINRELQTYIYNKYDTGTQLSFQAIFINPTTPESVETAILGLWNWIQSVLAYYYAAKEALIVGIPMESLDWDLSQFDATDPGLKLSDFVN